MTTSGGTEDQRGHGLSMMPSSFVAESKTECRPCQDDTPEIWPMGDRLRKREPPRAKVGEVTPRELFKRGVSFRKKEADREQLTVWVFQSQAPVKRQ